jgi:opacity protein-like surface antigen
MQLKKPIGVSLAAATAGLLGALPAAPAVAEEASNWEVDTTLLYYGEDGERVKDASLMTSIRRALDEDRSFNLSLTVDALTGATPSGAVPANTVQTFTSPSGRASYDVAAGEIPLDDNFLDTRIALAGNWQQSLGEAMRLNAGLSASHEYDYLHLGVNGRLERDFNQKNTTLFVGGAIAKDTIDPVGGVPVALSPMQAAIPGDDDEGGVLKAGGSSESKDVYDLLIGVTQVLSRRSLLEVAYSYSQVDGYQNDPYKILSVVDPVTGAPVAGPVGSGLNLYLFESRPDSRAKQSLFAEWRYALDRDSFAVSARYMTDDWGIDSQTVDARYRWNINERSYLEPHLRWYTQSAADFYRTALFAGQPLPQFASADYRLADSDAYTVGLKYGRRTERGEFSVRLEYYHQTADPLPGSAVGDLANFELVPPLDAVIAQFGYKFRF